VDIWASLLTFALGAATTVVAQWVQSWRELRLDREKRADDRRIDMGRAEAQTLKALQAGLIDLRLSLGQLHAAMRTASSPEPELAVYTAASKNVRLHGARVLSDQLSKAISLSGVLAGIVASTDDDRARADALGAAFNAIDGAETLLRPEIQRVIKGGFVVLE
jgi:hypothetical protein